MPLTRTNSQSARWLKVIGHDLLITVAPGRPIAERSLESWALRWSARSSRSRSAVGGHLSRHRLRARFETHAQAGPRTVTLRHREIIARQLASEAPGADEIRLTAWSFQRQLSSRGRLAGSRQSRVLVLVHWVPWRRFGSLAIVGPILAYIA